MGLQRPYHGLRHGQWSIVAHPAENGCMYYLVRVPWSYEPLRWWVPDGPLIAQLKREGVTA